MTAAFAALAVAASFAQHPSVPFATVVRGDGGSQQGARFEVRAIRTDAAWRAEWRRLNRNTAPAPARPRVDFRRHTLILATTGHRRTGGYGISVRSIRRSGRRLVVRAEERAPGTGCFVTQAHTSPYHVVRVRRTAARVSAVRRRIERDC
jgi:PrcB C-terminal